MSAILTSRRGRLGKAVGAFAPTGLSGLLIWYKADAITGLTDGNTVTSWLDSSGNSRTLTGNGTPLYKTGQQNGLPAVQFSGSSGNYLANAAFSQAQPSTLFVVARRLGSATGTRTPVNGGSGAAGASTLYLTGTNQLGLFCGGNFNGPTSTTNTSHVHEAVVNGSSSSMQVDGATATIGNPGGNSWVAPLNVGGNPALTEWFAGEIFEVIMYSGAKSTGDRALVRAYLGAKWGITVA